MRSTKDNEARGEKGTELLPYLGILDPESGEEIRKAIDDHCELIDVAEW